MRNSARSLAESAAVLTEALAELIRTEKPGFAPRESIASEVSHATLECKSTVEYAIMTKYKGLDETQGISILRHREHHESNTKILGQTGEKL